LNKTAFLALLSISILIMAISAQGQPNSGQTYLDSQYGNEAYPTDPQLLGWQNINQYQDQYQDQTTYETGTGIGYSSTVPSGAPEPVAPTSPESLRLQIPSETTKSASYTAPPAAEISQAFIPSSAASAGQLTGDVQGIQYNYNYPSQSQLKMVVPRGVAATNKLYISHVPETVAGCGLNGWLPMWLQTSSSGPIWFYEWYPSGQLSVNYLGFSSKGWQKKWFNGDTPGWHILQYHCRGWSNYIYVYVYSGGSGYWTDQGTYPKTVPTQKVVPSYLGTSSVTLRSSLFNGYDIYLDGKYVGKEGSGSDILDGVYSFKVPGNMWHTIVISKNGQSYDETGTFVNGAAYRFTL
jgi:hypothetical protein